MCSGADLPVRFITIEGGEGAGKSTQARALAAALAHRGPVLLTREPGGSRGAEAIRRLILEGKGFDPLAETLLHFAARADHAACVIAPALAAGITVICDRWADSTMAYQGFGMGGDRALIASLTARMPVQPDRTLLLDIDPALGMARALARAGADRYERLDAGFHARVAAGFRAIAAAEPARFRLIAADRPADAVLAAMFAALE